ncbi:TPA: tRNA (adenosine(37)-N6)-threonylcarbamoyltransferase complex ATPase subunit type 1 TsaE, partial [Candidatus Micrarchaeota archaeon]|nr:tRNA (adenosine(37)-N6)-threonylcarbamoyltransferase complex ATPase subunit type 1 TsaE [Candidatus Micrarchaeota archaeon]
MERVVITEGPEETLSLGMELAESLRDGDVVALVGELGVGKTTLVQGIARGLFVRDVVSSASFILARTYHGKLPLHHLDAYRVESVDEVFEAGLDRYLPPEEGVTVVEWADRIYELIPKGALWITLEFL